MKKFIRLLSLLLILTIGLSSAAGAVCATEATPLSNAYINSVRASVSKSDNTLYISFTVYGTGIMTSVGASCIKLYTSDGSLVKTFYSSAYPTMLGSNRGAYTGTVSYPGTSGKTYYAVVTAYAANSTGSGTENYTTGTVTI